MWLITPIGFFSIVQKPADASLDRLTVRARVRQDLEALRATYMPGLGEIKDSKTNDYRFRATAPRAEVAAAMAKLVQTLDYVNFKNQVAKVQGTNRAHLYHEVWDVLYKLQTEPTFSSTGPVFHPHKDENGKPVVLKMPSKPTPLETWAQPTELACVVPGGAMPVALNGIAVSSWDDVPKSAPSWEALAAQTAIAEPEFKVPAGYKKAAGVVVRETDGRFWVVAPSNQFGGYAATFPKGTMDGKSTQIAAMVEAYEETGLKVQILKHLVDVKRSQSYTRYFLAERVGGNPADMGWETQAVMLVPPSQLSKVLTNAYDQPILQALQASDEMLSSTFLPPQ